ncbi:hypothetical protein VIGAN_02053800, partial [Vigna angularis var. angularis]
MAMACASVTETNTASSPSSETRIKPKMTNSQLPYNPNPARDFKSHAFRFIRLLITSIYFFFFYFAHSQSIVLFSELLCYYFICLSPVSFSTSYKLISF